MRDDPAQVAAYLEGRADLAIQVENIIKKHAPNAGAFFDRFEFVKDLTHVLDEVPAQTPVSA